MATATHSSKKGSVPKPPVSTEDLEPLAGFLDEDEEEAPPPKKRPARNVGSLLAVPSSVPPPPESDEDVSESAAEEDGPDVEVPKTPHAAALYWREAKRVGPAHAKAALISKLVDRITAHHAELEKWGSDPAVAAALTGLVSANGYLATVTNALKSLPVGWTPPAKPAAGGPKTFAEGMRVSVKESARTEYEGVLEPDEMTGLTVQRHNPGNAKVACKTAAGSKVVIPRTHLVLDALPPAAASKEVVEAAPEEAE